MKREIKQVAVLGAGVMGSQIAAHLANVGIPSLLYDLNLELAQQGLARTLKLKPSPYYNPKSAKLITPCSYDKDLERLAEVDWVIEAIAEKLDWKRDLYQRITPHLNPQAYLTSNTSGLSAQDLMEGQAPEIQRRFFITHFFNPPRYMKLVEVVPGPQADPELLPPLVEFLEKGLGKGVVYAKDTPNFIANRIGVYGMMLTLHLTQKYHFTIPEVDALTGTLIGHPKSATFRTADVVGLDVLAFVAGVAYQRCVNDPERELFRPPEMLQKMLANKWLGQKSGRGFYWKKSRKEILALNLETLEYEPQRKRRFDAVRVAKGEIDLKQRLRALISTDDAAGKFLWELLAGTLRYSANLIPEISDDIVNVDRALRWGFGWNLGPFETWDALGVPETVARMEQDGMKVPAWVKELADSDQPTFYRLEDGKRYFYAPAEKKHVELETPPEVLDFRLLENAGKRIKQGWSASLVDLGDGVAAVELHSVLQPEYNPIDGSVIEMFGEGLEWVKEQGYQGLIIATQAPHFTAGANLNLILRAAQRRDWEGLERMSKAMQDVLQAIRFAPFPVVAAPHGLTLGGGWETISACHGIVASAELYTGLVEVGVGLIPGAGGNVRMLLNWMDKLAPRRPGPFPPVQKAFENISTAKVSTSAKEAQALGYLRRHDRIVLNNDYLLAEAKRMVLDLAKNFQPPVYREDLILPGKDGRTTLEVIIDDFRKAGKISDHDAKIGYKLAYVLTGGDEAGWTRPVSEQYLLDIEREAFVSLAAEPLTQARIAHMLKTGKPLRN